MLSVITLFLVIFCVSFNGCCNWMYWRIQKWFIHFNVFTSKFNLSPLTLVHKKLYENWTVDSSQTNMYHVKVELVPFIFDNYYAKYSTPLSELTLFFFLVSSVILRRAITWTHTKNDAVYFSLTRANGLKKT